MADDVSQEQFDNFVGGFNDVLDGMGDIYKTYGQDVPKNLDRYSNIMHAIDVLGKGSGADRYEALVHLGTIAIGGLLGELMAGGNPVGADEKMQFNQIVASNWKMTA